MMRSRLSVPFIQGLMMAFLISGCFYHTTQIESVASTEPSAEGSGLSDAEVDRATQVVSNVVSERGFLPSSSDVERLSRTEDEWQKFVLASYWTSAESATINRVVVSVRLDKRTRQFSVLIRDLDSAAASDFTNSLERVLTAELSKAFPSKTFEIERKTVGPALGP